MEWQYPAVFLGVFLCGAIIAFLYAKHKYTQYLMELDIKFQHLQDKHEEVLRGHFQTVNERILEVLNELSRVSKTNDVDSITGLHCHGVIEEVHELKRNLEEDLARFAAVGGDPAAVSVRKSSPGVHFEFSDTGDSRQEKNKRLVFTEFEEGKIEADSYPIELY